MSRVIGMVLVVALGFVSWASFGQTVTYQGKLDDRGAALTGQVDVRATLFDAATRGAVVGDVVTLSNVDVEAGLFTVELKFGADAFEPGEARWIGIEVRQGGGAYQALSPRQFVREVPVALEAGRALEADSAMMADVAQLALSGPFAPEDTSPVLNSGLPGQAIFTIEADINGNGFERVGLESDFELEAVGLGGSRFECVVTRRLQIGQASSWKQAFDTSAVPADLEMVLVLPSYGQTTWLLRNGVYERYGFVPGATGVLNEYLVLSFSGLDVQRNFQSNGLNAPLPKAPLPPGDAGVAQMQTGDMILFEWAGAQLPFAVGLELPCEFRPINPITGAPSGPVQAQPVALLSSALNDDTLWDAFQTGQVRSLNLVYDTVGSQITLELPQTPQATVSEWRFEIAPDGKPVETWVFNYAP